jgi:signal transduction histidine kinase
LTGIFSSDIIPRAEWLGNQKKDKGISRSLRRFAPHSNQGRGDMPRTKVPKSTRRRYIFTDAYEKDPGFSEYLTRMTSIGMRNAGIIGVLGPLVHFSVYVFLLGKKISLFYSLEDKSIYGIADKLLLIIVGATCILLSRLSLRPQLARLIVFFLLLIASMAMLCDNVMARDISTSTGYAILVMLVGVGILPFRPWQGFILGLMITLQYYFSAIYLPTLFEQAPITPKIESLMLLILATFLCTVIAMMIYLSRYILYRSRQKQAALRQSVAEHAEELEEVNRILRETQIQLIQSEKMASLGNLVAGVAHEINTPIGAVNSMYDTLFRTLDKLKRFAESELSTEQKDRHQLEKVFKVIDDSKKVIQSGIDRIINIITRLRSFARLDEAELKTVDIHEGLEDALILAHYELKKNITVVKNYGDIPPITCFPSQLNQVYLNLLINGKQSIKTEGTITITTYCKDDKVYISFEDNGAGIPEENLDKIFDPGFTTKGVRVGTGLGLSISYKIIQQHKGEIKVESTPGKGSKFTIVLPSNLKDLIDKENNQQ